MEAEGEGNDWQRRLFDEIMAEREVNDRLAPVRARRGTPPQVKHRTHVDTVLAYRARYLEEFGKRETDERFKSVANDVTFDWETINAKRTAEGDDSDDDDAHVGFGPIGGGGGGGDHK